MAILKFSGEEMCKTNQFYACPCSEAFNSEDFYEFRGLYCIWIIYNSWKIKEKY